MIDKTSEETPSHVERLHGKPRKRTLPQNREDALDWLAYETANVAREAQMRIQDATEFATDFARGRISPSEFKKRDSDYSNRWGEPLGGVADSRGMSDKEIHEEMARLKRSSAPSRER